MIRGLYISAAGMSSQMKNHEVISNNLANVDTAGFKKDEMVFESFREFLLSRVDDPTDIGGNPVIGSVSLGVLPDDIVTDYSVGVPQETGRNLDLAIQGEDGFFVVETPQGARYTRAGNFHQTAGGAVVTSDGYPVLGDTGPIQIGQSDFVVSQAGDVIVDGEIVNRILVVAVPEDALVKEGDSLFRAQEDAAAVPLLDATVYQGFLESSNVNAVEEMIDMISGLRLYEANQRSLSVQDETLAQLLNESLRG
ncbi:MAG: flagellar basal-body rod protein FlgF [Candidatus Omnitrophica bacterium]|nr:flagellar basal-body rod protein FlgF [Candidatus Omnitrophota bacterium]